MEAIIGAVIAFWIILSIVGAAGRTKQQGQQGTPMPRRRPSPMPPFGGDGGQIPPFMRQEKREQHAGQERTQPAYDEAQPTWLESSETQTHRSWEFDLDETRSEKGQDSSIAAEKAKVAKKRQRITEISKPMEIEELEERGATHPLFNQQNVVNGIIWSEILGPPKSRRRMR